MSRLNSLLSGLKFGTQVVGTWEHANFAVAVVAMTSLDPDRAVYDAQDFTIVHNQDYADPVKRPDRDYTWFTDSETACKQALALFEGWTLDHATIVARRKARKAMETAIKKAQRKGVPLANVVVQMQPWEFGMMKPDTDLEDNEGADCDIKAGKTWPDSDEDQPLAPVPSPDSDEGGVPVPVEPEAVPA